jgi:hypothetical protein
LARLQEKNTLPDQESLATRSFFGRLNLLLPTNTSLNYLDEEMVRQGSRVAAGGHFPIRLTFMDPFKRELWESLSKYVSYAKIRASYGALGNQDIENYLFVERLPIYSNPPLSLHHR